MNDKGNNKLRWAIGLGLVAVLLAFTIWRVALGSPEFLYHLRLFTDRDYLRDTLHAWGWRAPVVFILIQALQVIISPIPGEVTGYVGGVFFGLGLGFVYSTIGLTLGTMVAFWIGRWLGVPLVRRYVHKEVWERFEFIVEAEGAILAFIIYLIPGVPKDMISYLFGISPIPTRVFALVSTLGRMLGTGLLSALGAATAKGHYVGLALLVALTAAAAIPLYYYRHRIVGWLRRSATQTGNRA